LEKKEIKRELEIEAYKLYIEKLKREFPSHFASNEKKIYRK
jgi:hypothetical protein